MPEPSKEELMARIAELEKQVGSKKQGSLEFKVGEKGGVSVYGLGRFPVTLYYEQVGAPARRSRQTPCLSRRKQEQAEIEKQSITIRRPVTIARPHLSVPVRHRQASDLSPSFVLESGPVAVFPGRSRSNCLGAGPVGLVRSAGSLAGRGSGAEWKRFLQVPKRPRPSALPADSILRTRPRRRRLRSMRLRATAPSPRGRSRPQSRASIQGARRPTRRRGKAARRKGPRSAPERPAASHESLAIRPDPTT